MKTYSFSEKYRGGTDDKTIHILPFCAKHYLCGYESPLPPNRGQEKPLRLLQAKALAEFVEGSLWFMVFWEVFVLLSFLPTPSTWRT